MKFISLVALIVGGVAALAVAGPALIKVLSAAVWLVLAIGLVACVIRLVWAATRRW
jgi:hypothetical protein